MPHFRKKPVVIEALQFDGNNCRAVLRFMGESAWDNAELHDTDRPVIHTLEGTMTATEGDWIIKGVKGEFYPCKPDIFAATYEPVAAEPYPLPPKVSGDEVERVARAIHFAKDHPDLEALWEDCRLFRYQQARAAILAMRSTLADDKSQTS